MRSAGAPGWRTVLSSYQSAGTKRTPKTSRATLVVVALLTLAAKPYEDTQRRFRFEPARGWRLTPAFGDLHGTRFSRSIDGFENPATFVWFMNQNFSMDRR